MHTHSHYRHRKRSSLTNTLVALTVNAKKKIFQILLYTPTSKSMERVIRVTYRTLWLAIPSPNLYAMLLVFSPSNIVSKWDNGRKASSYLLTYLLTIWQGYHAECQTSAEWVAYKATKGSPPWTGGINYSKLDASSNLSLQSKGDRFEEGIPGHWS